MKTQEPLFDSELPTPVRLGCIEVTAAAQWALTRYDVALALVRHANHDWGIVSRRGARRNDQAAVEGKFLHSEYRSRLGKRFFVATQADRARTVVLLPAEV